MPKAFERWALAIVLAVFVAVVAVPTALRFAGPLGASIVALAALGGTPVVSRRLPSALDGLARARPVRAVLFALAVVVALFQIGRLSAFMAEPTRQWGSAVPDPAGCSRASSSCGSSRGEGCARWA